ncbi:hypothetical protein HZS_4585 [Henneguya salminicola]|nr:hypothetical protein HZS_4585 [Henneguya salminicola]
MKKLLQEQPIVLKEKLKKVSQRYEKDQIRSVRFRKRKNTTRVYQMKNSGREELIIKLSSYMHIY